MVTSTDRRGRQAARSSTANDEYLREASRLRNTTEKEDWMLPRQEARTKRGMIEVQNDAMVDRNSE